MLPRRPAALGCLLHVVLSCWGVVRKFEEENERRSVRRKVGNSAKRI